MIATAPIVAIASQLAGTSVVVECDKNTSFPKGERGFVMFTWDEETQSYQAEHRIHLPASVCAGLNALYSDRRGQRPLAMQDLASPNGPVVRIADGANVHVLVHEAMHIRLDSTDEALVERAACRNAWSGLKLFKLAAWKSRQVLRGMRIAHLSSDPSYLTDGC